MTTKTIGQVLYEAEGGDGWLYPHLDFSARDVYERRAQAVAAVVREQVAAWVEPQRDFIPATGAEFAAAIRGMKI